MDPKSIHAALEADSNKHSICDTCVKKDVCMYKPQVEKAEGDINKISERTNVFIEVSIKCKYWLGQTATIR